MFKFTDPKGFIAYIIVYASKKLLLNLLTFINTNIIPVSNSFGQQHSCYVNFYGLQEYIDVYFVWVKVFKNEPSKICGRQPLKNMKWYDRIGRPYYFIFFKAIFHKFYSVHS